MERELEVCSAAGCLEAARLRHVPSGSEVTVFLFGATVTSWTLGPDRGNQEMLFLSNEAVFDGKKPIRGGIPLVFPQFGAGIYKDELPSHGFARRSLWVLDGLDGSDGALVLSLSDCKETRASWMGRKFRLEYRIYLDATSLRTSLTVKNLGDESFRFQALFHTYYLLGSVTSASVSGLEGCVVRDKLAGQDEQPGVDVDKEIVFTAETDRIYVAAPASVQVNGLGNKREVGDSCGEKKQGLSDDVESVTISINVSRSAENETPTPHDVVVWNPWVAKSKRMGDFGDEEFLKMCCVEPGLAENCQLLLPGEAWTMTQHIACL